MLRSCFFLTAGGANTTPGSQHKVWDVVGRAEGQDLLWGSWGVGERGGEERGREKRGEERFAVVMLDPSTEEVKRTLLLKDK
jgi:hypothetical protein